MLRNGRVGLEHDDTVLVINVLDRCFVINERDYFSSVTGPGLLPDEKNILVVYPRRIYRISFCSQKEVSRPRPCQIQ